MKHIIIADDDPGIQDIMAIILKRNGYAPEVHNNADKLMRDEFSEPELFIIDKQLGEIDGLEVCRHLKSRDHVHTPIILFSASNQLQEFAQSVGADAFLAKPFTVNALLTLVKRFTAE